MPLCRAAYIEDDEFAADAVSGGGEDYELAWQAPCFEAAEARVSSFS